MDIYQEISWFYGISLKFIAKVPEDLLLEIKKAWENNDIDKMRNIGYKIKEIRKCES